MFFGSAFLEAIFFNTTRRSIFSNTSCINLHLISLQLNLNPIEFRIKFNQKYRIQWNLNVIPRIWILGIKIQLNLNSIEFELNLISISSYVTCNVIQYFSFKWNLVSPKLTHFFSISSSLVVCNSAEPKLLIHLYYLHNLYSWTPGR